MDRVSILYIVGKNAPTSIPLEVADAINRRGSDITVVAFQARSNGEPADTDCQVKEIGAHSIYDPVGVWNLYKVINEVQPDVVHVHHTVSSFWGTILAKWVFDASVVRTEHNNQRHYTVAQNVLHGCAQALADRILCNSKDTYDNLYSVQKWLVGDDWEVVYNGVNVERIERASSRTSPFSDEVPSDQTLIGSVGRLVDQKNYGCLIDAFSLLAEEMSGVHLVIIGDGDKREELESKAKSEGIHGRVTFTSELPRDAVHKALHQFDLFVMPSLWEGFCNAVVEAMVAQVPIISSDISTLREVVGDVGNFADPEDPDDIAQGIVDILRKDPEERYRMGKEVYRRATNQFSLQRTVDEYIKTYLEVTGTNSKEIMPISS